MTAAPAAAPSPSPHAGEFEKLFAEIALGRLPVPNYEDMDLAQGVGHIAAASGLRDMGVMFARIETVESGRGNFARFFLNTTQGGRFDGTGFVMVFGAAGVGRIGRFAICRHVSKLDRGANPSRGWRPAHCEKCGLDMSVDSSG